MKRYLVIIGCLLLSLVVGHAQTFTPSSCTMTQPQGGPFSYPCAFNITSSGVTPLTAACCYPELTWYDSTGSVITSVNAPATVYLGVSGNADDRPAGTWPAGGTFCCGTPAIGAVAIPFTLTVIPRMVPIYSNALHVKDSALSNCANTSTTTWDYKDTCTLSTQALGGYTPPAKGSSYTDQIFGTTIWHLANIFHDYAVITLFSSDDQYVIVNGGCSAYTNGSVLGECGIYSTATKLKTYKTPCEQFSSCGSPYWSSVHPDRLYMEEPGGTGWHQYHLGVAPNLVDDGTIYTPSNGEILNSGGSMTFTPEDYEVHYEYVSRRVASVSGGVITSTAPISFLAPGKVVHFSSSSDSGLNGTWIVATAPTTSTFTLSGYTPSPGTTANFVCIDRLVVFDLEHRTTLISQPWESWPSMPMNARSVHISPKDTATQKWFVIATDDYSDPHQSPYKAARVGSFRAGDSTLTFEFYGPVAPEQPKAPVPHCTLAIASAVIGNCFTSAHDTELGVNGVAYFVHAGGRGDPYQSYATGRRLSAGDAGAISIYAGGGFNWWNSGIDHVGGSRLAPFLASNGDENGAQMEFAVNVASISGNLYTTDYPHGFSPGDAVIVAVDNLSTTDATLDGTYTVQTVPTMTTFTLTKTPSSYAANSAIVYKTGNDPNINKGHSQVTVCRVLPDGRVLQCRRIAMHLSTQFTASFHDSGYSGQTLANDYFAQPHVVLSQNGKWVGWTSNLMHGNRDYFYIAETGFSGDLQPNQFTPSTSVQVTPGGNSAAFHFTAPDMQDYTIEICTDMSLAAGCVTPVSSPGLALTHDATAGGLDTPVQYFWRIRSADDYYVAAGSFVTGSVAPIRKTKREL